MINLDPAAVDEIRQRLTTMSQTEIDELRARVLPLADEARREKARRSLFDFTAYTFPDYEPNWHHRVLCYYLDLFARRVIKRLMVFMPPRHGKSEHVSRRLPAYLLGQNPNVKIISASYNADLASSMNRDVQRIIDDEKYYELYPETRLNGKNIRNFASGGALRNSDIFEVMYYKGYYKSAGIGGGITGRGFDYGIIDDPIKDRAEAESQTYRDGLWDWYTSVFYTRREKAASILLTVTRWHEDDLAARLISKMKDDPAADQWVILTLPAINVDGVATARLPAPTEDDPGRTQLIYIDPRQPGEALWADKYDLADIQATQATLTEYEFNALYQQTPTSRDGGIYKAERIDIIDIMPRNIIKVVRFWDLALSEKASADYTVGFKLGLTAEGRLVILDIVRQQIEYENLDSLIADTAIRDTKSVLVGIETAFLQTRIVKKLAKRLELLEYTIMGVPVETDKFTRALPFAAKVGNRQVDMMRAGWNTPLKAELKSFPRGKNDDQSDAGAGALALLDKAAPLGTAYSLLGYGDPLTGNPQLPTPEELYAQEYAAQHSGGRYGSLAHREKRRY